MKTLVVLMLLGLGVVGWAASATNKVEKATSESKEPNGVEEEPETPRPTFKPKERIPVDQGVDFPVDI